MDKHIKEVGMVTEDNSRRSFFKKAAGAVGVVAAAGYTMTSISKYSKYSKYSASTNDASAKYAADIALQEKVMTGKRLVLMTDDEKKQRLEALLNFHNQEIA